MHYNNLLSNLKSSCTHFLIKVLLITVISQRKVMMSFLDTMTAYDCPRESSLTFVLTEMLKISHLKLNDIGIPDLKVKISI